MTKKTGNWRSGFILVLIVLFGAAIMSRLFFLQILERKLFQAQALGQQTNFNSITGSRGQIFCATSQESKGNSESLRGVKSLAVNKDSWTISVNPNDISNKLSFAETLSKNIVLTSEEILLKLESQDSYVVLKKDLSSAELEKIKALKLKGLFWQNEPDRFYPQGQMASQVLGFLGGGGSGQYGVEGYYDEILSGKFGIEEEKSGIAFLFSNDSQASLDGANVYLTIDYNIQFQDEALLKHEQKKNDIDSGQIIVLKPDTGKILALANFPNFNPNQYSKESDLSIFQNSAVQKLFEPGSIMKPFTMAAALNEGKITPDATYVDEGSLTLSGRTIRNFNDKIYGQQTMTQVLENSINTGAVFAQAQLDHKTFLNYLERFGFFEKTGIDLQGEVYSVNNNLKNGPDINYATASFGQGVDLTPIQIARGFCAIANGGKLVKPYIVDRIDGVYTKPEVSRPVVSQNTISQLNSMLISVVENGFNKVARIPGYYFAGKTGTAQVPLTNGGGYDPYKTIQSFVGYGPALNPQFLILVKLDNPKVASSSLSAVPIFKQLAQYIINYWQIPPDYEVK